MGNLEGVSLLVLLGSWRALEMEHLLLNQFGLLFWIQITLGATVWGAVRNVCEGPGLPWLGIRVWGTKGLF